MIKVYPDFDRLLSFSSVHHALRAEKLLLIAGLMAVSLPTPREIAISCGQCLLVKSADQEKIMGILENHQVQWSKLLKRNIQEEHYEEIESR